MSLKFRQGQIGKTYLALVRGGAKTFPSKSGIIENTIEYNDGFFHALHDAASQNGEPSVTEWEVLASSVRLQDFSATTIPSQGLSTQSYAPISLLRLGLRTGNKHQLRIHLSKVLGGEALNLERKAVFDRDSSPNYWGSTVLQDSTLTRY